MGLAIIIGTRIDHRLKIVRVCMGVFLGWMGRSRKGSIDTIVCSIASISLIEIIV